LQTFQEIATTFSNLGTTTSLYSIRLLSAVRKKQFMNQGIQSFSFLLLNLIYHSLWKRLSKTTCNVNIFLLELNSPKASFKVILIIKV